MLIIIRWAPSALLLMSLVACGGGGDDGSAPVVQPQEATVSSAVVTPETPNPGPSVTSLVVSPQQFNLLAFTDSGGYQYQELTLNGQFVGDRVAISYAPSAASVSWLSFSSSMMRVVPEETFSMPLTMMYVPAQAGHYDTFLRVVSGYANSNVVTGIVDVPVHLRVTQAPPIFMGEVVMASGTSKLASVSRTIPLDFGNFWPDSVEVSLTSETGDASRWMTVTNNWRTGSMLIRPRNPLPPGIYNAALNVSYIIQGARGLKTIPVTLEVKADTPVVNQASPGYVTLQQASQLELRGHGFSKATAISVSLGGVMASSVAVVDDTAIRVSFSATPARGEYPLQVTMDGFVSMPAKVRVQPPMSYVLEDIELPCQSAVAGMIFDPSRGNIIAFCEDATYLVSQIDGAWKIVKRQQITGMGSLLLTHDQKFLLAAGDAKIYLLDPSTLETIETRPIPVIWYQSAGYGFLSLEMVLNDGKILMTIGGMARYYYIYDLYNDTMVRSNQDYSDAHIVNRASPALAQGTAQLVYVKSSNRPSAPSSDPSLFTATFFAAPDDWMADYAFPGTSPDGLKAARYAYGEGGLLFNLYETTTIRLIGPIINKQSYAAASLMFTQSGRELYIIDAKQGRFDIYGAVAGDTTLHHATTFQPYDSFAGSPKAYITPDQGAVILYSPNQGSNARPGAVIKILPIPR